jgi:hypothetical protein
LQVRWWSLVARARRVPRRFVAPPSPAARRAIRAATEREPWWPAGFGFWVLGRVLAAGLMLAAAWLVYDFASSTRFDVQAVHIQGNQLLTRAEVQDTASVIGANIFWVNQAEVVARLSALPLVQHVEISTTLPGTVDIHIVERQPAGFWTSGEQTFLVDKEGVILKAVDAETAQIRACAGQPCDGQSAGLPSVAEEQAEELMPGDHVDANALTTSARLASLLPSVGVQPLQFQWSPDTGLDVATAQGWTARFDQAGNLEQQVSALGALEGELARRKTSAALIDVRFGDRPYFR